ncbi:MAG: Crp/Fnr family transcriptional regulator [Dehalococcoidia bacterium]
MVSHASVDTQDTRVKSLLARLPLFAGLPSMAMDEVAQHIRVRRYDRGTVIFHKDDPGSLLYIILTGAVTISVPTNEGKDLVLNILAAGDFFGELSLFDEEPRSATAEALEDNTQTLILPRQSFLELVADYPQMATHIITLLSRRLRETNALAQDACLLDLPGRLSHRLIDLAAKYGRKDGETVFINLRLTQAELASLVGATRVATNRQIQKMQQRGLLHWENQHITLLKPDALRKLALG